MRFLFAIVCPPLAVLLCGKPVQFLLNIVLTCCMIVPGIVHAMAVVNSHKADKRNAQLIRAINHQ